MNFTFYWIGFFTGEYEQAFINLVTACFMLIAYYSVKDEEKHDI